MSPKGSSSHARPVQQERKNKEEVLIQVKDVPMNGWNPKKGTTNLHENEHSDLNISYIQSNGIMRTEG